MDDINTTNKERPNSTLDNNQSYEEITAEIVEENIKIERIENDDENKENLSVEDLCNNNCCADFNIRPENVEGDSFNKQAKMSSTYILLVIFIILLGVSYVIKNKVLFNKNEFGENNKIIVNAEVKDVDKIEISKNEEITVIEKNEDGWEIIAQNNFIADQQAVASLIEEAFKLNKYILASENIEKYSDFEVDAEKGTNVKLYKGKEVIANFYIGKAGHDFDSTYFRIDGDDSVYLSKGYVRYYFDKDEWRNLAIYDFDAEKVNKLALKYRVVADNVMMDKVDGIWKIQGASAKDANKEKVDSVLNVLAKLKAQDIEYTKNIKECGFSTASLVVRIELEDGGKRNLIIGGKLEDNENKYYAKREEDATIFVINKSTVDNLMKKVGDF